MDYNEIAPKLQSGDIFLFRGKTLVSRMIDFMTDSIYSHAGMVVRQPDLQGKDTLYLWQSFEPEGGVVRDHLEEFLSKYKTSERGSSFVVRQLTVERTPAMVQALNKFMAEVKGYPFPSVLTWFVHWVGGNLGIPSGLKNFFCSQLIAQTYIRMGIFPKRPPATAYTPGRFSAKYKKLRFEKGASLGPEILVTLPKPASKKKR